MTSNLLSRPYAATLSAFLLLSVGMTTGAAAVLTWGALDASPSAAVAASDPPQRFAWVEGRIAPVEHAFGIPEADLRFLDEFDHPILDGIPEDRAQLRARLEAIHAIGWSRTRDLIRERMPQLDERSAFMMFTLLRVNGSLPVYEVTSGAPKDLKSLLMVRRGNCTEATWRTLMWLDTLGLPGRVMQLWTPSMPGHVVADVFDPVSGRAYMLDANLNTLAWLPSDGRGFFDILFDKSLEERRALFAEGSQHLVEAPWFMRWYDPGTTVDRRGLPSLEDMNRLNHATRAPRWRATLTDERDTMVERWRKVWPGGQPRTLDEYSNPAIVAFGLENVLPQEPLLVKLGLNLPKWSKRARVDAQGPLRLDPPPGPSTVGSISGGSGGSPS